MDYEKQATDFLEKTGTVMTVKFVKYDKYFPDDKEKRDIYNITLKRGNREYTFTFGQSIVNSGYKIINENTHKQLAFYPTDDKTITSALNSKYRHFKLSQYFYPFNTSCDKIIKPKAPTAYDVLACLEKYPQDTFEDFCANFGYDEDSRKAFKTYEAVKEQYIQLSRLFTDKELEEMAEIQ